MNMYFQNHIYHSHTDNRSGTDDRARPARRQHKITAGQYVCRPSAGIVHL